MNSHRFCVAPMLDVTDRHCRYFHRQLSRKARLYTEMVTTGALLHGPRERLLAFDPVEHPVVLQLGGSDPGELARAARLGERAGYDEINLNCGCPSERVQRGAFGACLMAEPALVAECVGAMRDAVSVPVTVKHRVGLGRVEDYGFLRDFVGTVAQAGCEVFIVHARNAWLEGLSPRENRTVPPLRYEVAQRLAHEFPALAIVLNGGLRDHRTALAQLAWADGVMVGREACDEPWMLAEVDERYFGVPARGLEREAVIDAMRPTLRRELAAGVALRTLVRPMLGLFNGLPGARHWRRTLSDSQALAQADRSPDRLIDRALAAMRTSVPRDALHARTAECR